MLKTSTWVPHMPCDDDSSNGQRGDIIMGPQFHQARTKQHELKNTTKTGENGKKEHDEMKNQLCCLSAFCRLFIEVWQ